MEFEMRLRILLCLEFILMQSTSFMWALYLWYLLSVRRREFNPLRRNRRWAVINKQPAQFKYIRHLLEVSDVNCIDNLRMDRNAFSRLCYLLQHVGGLCNERFVCIPTKVAMFLTIIAHHKKNRVVKGDFLVSGQTVSKYFRQTLKAVIRIGNLLLIDPVPISGECTKDPWKHFKGCLGALDGTYVDVTVSTKGQPKYRTRTYYLCDCGYTNAEGFLAPYRETRYNLKEWGAGTLAPQNPRELFNLRHSKAWNIIERVFCLLNGRWAILRSRSFYPIKIQNLTILACALLHNFIQTQMSVDPMEEKLPGPNVDTTNNGNDTEFIAIIEASTTWRDYRDNLAEDMFQASRN